MVLIPCQKALAEQGIETLRPIQLEMLNAFNNHDTIQLLSPTGSGKTLAFLLPITQQLKSGINRLQCLVIAPSRELAQQIERVFRSLKTGVKIVCCYGGHNLRLECDQLNETPGIIIATPGRILDHIRRGRVMPSTVETLVLDEFDKCLELGFTEEMEAIIQSLPSLQHRILTSATNCVLPEYTGMIHPKVINFLKTDEPLQRLSIYQCPSFSNDKLDTLAQVLANCGIGQKIVFCNYRESVERIANYMRKKAIPVVEFHGGMEQAERERALVKFRNGSSDIIIATDLAARGLDIPDIKDIIHYHLPLSEESYTHRNGRTARMGTNGRIVLIVGPDEYLPEYVDQNLPHFKLDASINSISIPEWTTLYIGKGRKDKVSKGDIVGFLIQQGEITKEDIGSIELKELHAYVGIKRNKINEVLKKIRPLKIKKMKAKFEESL